MNPVVLSLCACAALTQSVAAQVTNVRSSIDSLARVTLSVVDEGDLDENRDEQFGSTTALGPVDSIATVSSAQGTYYSTITGSASFTSNQEMTFQSNASYEGNQAPGKVEAQSFGHTLNSLFEYDFIIPENGSININGTLLNGGPSVLEYNAVVQVLAESTIGGGFTGAFFEQLVLDTSFDSENFDFTVPLEHASGSYRVTIRLSHSGTGQLETDVFSGSLNSNITITAESSCAPDLNGDGLLDFFDISAFLTAFSANDPIADFNADGVYDFFDVSAFLSLYSAGC